MDSYFSEVFDISLPGRVIWCEKYLLKINGTTSSALRSITCWTFHRISVLIWKSCLTSNFSFRHLNTSLISLRSTLGSNNVNVLFTHQHRMFTPKGKGVIEGDYMVQWEGGYSNSSSETKFTNWIYHTATLRKELHFICTTAVTTCLCNYNATSSCQNINTVTMITR